MDGNLAMADHIVNMTEEEMDQLQQLSEPDTHVYPKENMK